jgi:hypothetical protein
VGMEAAPGTDPHYHPQKNFYHADAMSNKLLAAGRSY